jgi:hypothetical protein
LCKILADLRDCNTGGANDNATDEERRLRQEHKEIGWGLDNRFEHHERAREFWWGDKTAAKPDTGKTPPEPAMTIKPQAV